MLDKHSDEQLRLAARLYYLDGLAQSEVAKFVKVSQAKVSRLLAAARELGVVRISVAEYEPRNQALERSICSAFGLNAVAVIKVFEGAGSEHPLLPPCCRPSPWLPLLEGALSTS
jgi:deoxyribonucleoside regulator